MELIKEMYLAEQEGREFAVATVAGVSGVTPAVPGKKLLVYADGKTVGTIGGGALELKVVNAALEALRSGSVTLSEITKDDSCGAVCVTVLIEPHAPRRTVVVCGAGHVGAALLSCAQVAGFRTILIDDRDTPFVAENAKRADAFIKIDDFAGGIEPLALPKDAFYFVGTYSHAKDGAALAGCLAHADGAYYGMLGAKHKRDELYPRLTAQGIAPERLAAVHCPIGLRICDQSPAEIAFAIMAEMLMVKNGKE